MVALACGIAGLWNGGARAAAHSSVRLPAPIFVPIPYAQLIVTSGEIREQGGGELALRSPTVRAVVGREPMRAAEVTFRFLGPTREQVALASGELRRQIGIKLRARDTCNVIYAMWHILPTPGLHISVKSNPGKSEYRQCTDDGYGNLKPESVGQVLPEVHIGERHTLSAQIDGNRLRVAVDGREAWVGRLPPEALRFDGPIGIRSDNGEFLIRLRGAPWAAEAKRVTAAEYP